MFEPLYAMACWVRIIGMEHMGVCDYMSIWDRDGTGLIVHGIR